MNTTAYGRLVDALTSHGSTVTEKGDHQAVANCPGPVHANGDRNPSLALRAGEGQVLLYCHAGDSPGDVADALGLTMADLFDDRRGRRYEYRDADGKPSRYVTRTPKKDFIQKSAVSGVKPRDLPRYLYRLPEVLDAVNDGRTIVLVEGEKDADQVNMLLGPDVVGTSGVEGAGRIGKTDLSPLTGACVIAIPDRDAAGDKWAAAVVEHLGPIVKELVFMRAAVGNDISDHLAAGLDFHELDDYTPPAAADPEAEFWQSRRILSTVHAAARARATDPWGVLLATLVRVSLQVPPSVVLPPVGDATTGHAPLGLYVALTGRAGGGKGIVEKAARAVLALPDDSRQVRTIGAGSGEGIADALTDWVDDPDDVAANKKSPRKVPQPFAGSVHLSDSEVDKLAAILKRDGSTLGGVLNQVWSGEAVSFPYRNKAVDVQGHTYRASLTLGVQMLQAGSLFDRGGSGTLQRFVWAPTSNPRPGDYTRHVEPRPLEWVEPNWPTARDGMVALDVAEDVGDEVWCAYVDRDELSSDETRTNENRLRVAGLLAITEQRTAITWEDWTVAGVVMDVSRRTRDMARDVLADRARQERAAKAEARADTEVLVADRLATATAKRVTAHILRRLASTPDGMTGAELRRSARSTDRPDVDSVLADLVHDGQVISEATEYRGQNGSRYHLAAKGGRDE